MISQRQNQLFHHSFLPGVLPDRSLNLLYGLDVATQPNQDEGVRADVVVGSAHDPREASVLGDYAVQPGALVMTEGADGGYVDTANGRKRFAPARAPSPVLGAYGAGDSFAGALTWYLASGLDAVDAAERAAVHGAAVLGGANPLEHQLRLA